LKIPLTRILLEERRRDSETKNAKGRPGFGERLAFSIWAYFMGHPGIYSLSGSPIRKILRFLGLGRWRRHYLPPLFEWSKGRDFPPLSKEPFLKKINKNSKKRRRSDWKNWYLYLKAGS